LVKRTNQDFLEYLARKSSISTVLAQILVNRGIKDTESIKHFLSPSLDILHDPFLMPDMEKAVERIHNALHKNETVLVYGDYDADGLTSTALLVSVLGILGIKTHYYIPDRITEGYGLNKSGIQKARGLGVSLLITADCGVSSTEEVSLAKTLGIDVIITDHHEPPEELPAAHAVINPHRIDSQYPFRHLAGVGVAFKLCQGLFNGSQFTDFRSELENFLDLVAVGTVADSVPLTGENRILTTFGVKTLNRSDPKPWVLALKEAAGLQNKDLHSTLLSYTIIPRINAVGRLGNSHRVVEFFLSQDKEKAREIASFIDTQNKKRQKIEEDVCKSALEMIDPHHLDSAIVLSSAEWHPGVIGIVSSRLVDMFYRPVFLFSVKDTVAKGSARSIPPFHIYQGVSACSELLLAYGGHSQAAGLSISVENLPAFKEKINTIAKTTLDDVDMIPTLEIDAGVEFSEINFNLVRELNLLEPFGNANQKPVLGAKEIEIIDPKSVGNNHLKAKSKQKSITIETIGFSMAQSIEKIEDSLTIDIAFTPCINEWNGKRSLQLNLKALKPSL
jgi:single-stranded-DNA-specific exonuclease